jgi:hypothetical protein
VGEIVHLGFDLLRVDVVERDLAGGAADQGGIGDGRTNGPGTDDRELGIGEVGAFDRRRTHI